MGFSTLERIKIAEKAIFASVKNSDPNTQWYEATNPSRLVLFGGQVWTNPDLSVLLANPQATIASAQAFAAANPTIVEDRSASASAVRLTPVPGINNTYVALSTYNDFASARLENWIQPQHVPQANGQPSLGYFVQLYDGDPASGGTLVGPTAGQTGTGQNTTVGWIFDYAGGLLLTSEDFSVADPYITGFRYIGSTALNPSTGSSSNTIIEDANCLASDLVGDCVKITGSRVGGKLQVTKIDITADKRACGIIISKSSSTDCQVQLHGSMVGVYTGLSPNSSYMIDTAARLTTILPVPPASGFVYVQHMGYAISSNEFFVSPSIPTKRID